MTLKEFDQFWQQLCEDEHQLLQGKGIEYSGENNRFRNFEKLGTELELHPAKIAWIYLKKHLDSLLSYINKLDDPKYKEQISEPILGRIHDARNYLALIGGMLND